jgi:hypothetical protein
LNVIPVSDDICSLRLDFTTFVISGPSTWTIQQGRRHLGQPSEAQFDAYTLEGISWTTNCFTDAFYTQGASPSSNPPVICGVITGEHMYVEADVERGNKLMFSFSDMAVTTNSITRGVTTLATRQWDITISHIECTSLTLPPNGCTKYFWNDAGRATLKNYNFVAGDALASVHLAQQHERMCIRRERGFCVGCFSAAEGDFDISMGKEGLEAHHTVANGCCGYNTQQGIVAIIATANVDQNGWSNAAGGQFGWDCIIIPGAYFGAILDEGDIQVAQTTALMQQVIGIAATPYMNVPSGPQICGTEGIGPGVEILSQTTATAALGAAMDEGEIANALTVCTRHTPFTLEFMSDDLEGVGIIAGDTEFNSATHAHSQGFNILHTQLAC